MSQEQLREVAHRMFAREFSEATHTFTESDEDRAPVYALLPTGAKANRVFVVGTLTETEDIGDESEYWRGRVVDPVGTFFVYAGTYQLQPKQQLRDIDPPEFVAVVGKPRTYESDGGGTYVSIQPESIAVVDEQTRNRWVVETADRTIDRIKQFEESENTYATMAQEQYSTSIDVFQQDAVQALHDLMDSPDADAELPDLAADEPTTEQPPEHPAQDSPNGPSGSHGRDEAVDGDVVVAQLIQLGNGDPVGRDRLISSIRDEYGVDASVVEAAIEAALGSGRCVRSDVDELMPI